MPLQRPIGFSPAEISALINEPVVAQHAEEAAFLWTQRDRAVGEPHYSLDDIARLDERVEAHVNGLRIAGDVGWKLCLANLPNGSAGEVFALSIMAFSAGDRERMREALHAGCVSVVTMRGLVSALGWLDYFKVAEWIPQLLRSPASVHRAVGVAASAAHRQDPGVALAEAIDGPDVVLRARALRAAGELKRTDLRNQLRRHLQDADESCRFWAAWALALHRDSDGWAALATWLDRDDARSRRAIAVALRSMPVEKSRDWVRHLTRIPHLGKLAVLGAGVVGDPASIPWLIRRMEDPDVARLAGEAFSMITGADLSYDDLDQDAPTDASGDTNVSIEEVLDLGYESNLRWPSAERVTKWWTQNAHAFSSGTRYLAGKPITPRSALEVLMSGKQRQRAAAAVELALEHPEQVLFEVRARGARQLQELAAWTS